MKPLAAASAANVVLHLAGLALAGLAIRPGTPLVGLDERLAYLAARPPGWTLAWSVWMLCALALVAFFALLAREDPGSAAVSLALVLGAAGAAVDLLCNSAQAFALPLIAAARPPEIALFLAAERAVAAGGLVAANGLYSVAVLLAALALRERAGALAFGLGLATFAFGMAMVAAGFTGVPRHAELATPPTILAFAAWTVAVARALTR